ncbi:putative M1 family aminopeptidase [Trichinella pseudospiralis]
MYGNGRRLTLSNNVGQAYIEADDFDARPYIDQSSVVELLECGSPNNLRSLLILSHQKTDSHWIHYTAAIIGNVSSWELHQRLLFFFG